MTVFLVTWRTSDFHIENRASLLDDVNSEQPKDLISMLESNLPNPAEFVYPIINALKAMIAMKPLEGAYANRDPLPIISINPNRVLSYAWKGNRLQTAIRLACGGSSPPPVKMHRVEFKGEHFYMVSDGHHRSEAARIVGINSIPAEIGTDYIINIDDFEVVCGELKLRSGGGSGIRRVDTVNAAVWLGVLNRGNS